MNIITPRCKQLDLRVDLIVLGGGGLSFVFILFHMMRWIFHPPRLPWDEVMFLCAALCRQYVRMEGTEFNECIILSQLSFILLLYLCWFWVVFSSCFHLSLCWGDTKGHADMIWRCPGFCCYYKCMHSFICRGDAKTRTENKFRVKGSRARTLVDVILKFRNEITVISRGLQAFVLDS